MSSDFNWQTDDDGAWEALSDVENRSTSKAITTWFQQKSKFLLPLLLLFLLIGLAIIAVLNRRAEEARNHIATDVFAAHNLLHQAVQDRDADLLDALLYDDDSSWHELQLTLLSNDLFFNRRPLSLISQTEPDIPLGQPPAVSLSPDLQTATLTETITLATFGQTRPSETVRLERTFVYQLEESSWLMAKLPDDEAFWGTWRMVEPDEQLTLIYSLRDEETAQYLAEPLVELIGRICQDDQVECPRNFKLELRLSRDPQDLIELNQNYRNVFFTSSFGRDPFYLSLPGPTLIGRPVDEAGYQALYQGYANWLGSILASRYAVDLDQPLAEKLAAWRIEAPPSPVRALPLSNSLTKPPVPFPDQDILLVCNYGGSLGLLRYDLFENEWSDEMANGSADYLLGTTVLFPFPRVISFPEDDGVIISLYTQTAEGGLPDHSLVAWRDGQEQLLFHDTFGPQLAPSSFQKQFDPTGQRLAFFTNFAAESGPFQIQVNWLDLQACLSGNCQMETAEGLITTAPNEEHWLVSALNGPAMLTLRNNQSEAGVVLENGFMPIWLDDERFVYVRAGEGPPGSGLGLGATADIILTTVADPAAGTVLFNTADMAAILPQRYKSAPVSVQLLVRHPEQPDQLFLAVTAFPEGGPEVSFILSYRLDTAELTMYQEWGSLAMIFSFEFSPDHQFLTIRSSGSADGSSGSDGRIIFLKVSPSDLPDVQEYVAGFNEHDWSQDGRWLLLNQERSLRLIAPGAQYETVVRHNLDECGAGVWVNKTAADSDR